MLLLLLFLQVSDKINHTERFSRMFAYQTEQFTYIRLRIIKSHSSALHKKENFYWKWADEIRWSQAQNLFGITHTHTHEIKATEEMKIGKKHTYVKTLDRKSCLISFIIGVESFRLRFLRVWFVLLQHVWNRYIVGQDNLCIRFCVFSFHYCSALMHSIEMDQLRKSRQIFDRLENLLPSLCFFFLFVSSRSNNKSDCDSN